MKHKIIYADPPWWYNNRRMSGKRTRFGGGACAHYKLMRDKEIVGMGEFVQSIADENCALFLWTTCPRLDVGLRVIEAWGFRYCTVAFHWVKTRPNGLPIFGPGYYTSSNAELCLLGVKGSMPPENKMVPSLVMYPRSQHSEKPAVVRERIEKMYGDVPRIELFARHRVAGWEAWGDQVGQLPETTPMLAMQ